MGYLGARVGFAFVRKLSGLAVLDPLENTGQRVGPAMRKDDLTNSRQTVGASHSPWYTNDGKVYRSGANPLINNCRTHFPEMYECNISTETKQLKSPLH